MASGNIYSVKEIDKKWNRQMLQILKQSPVETPLLKIVFDREPDIFTIPEKKSAKLKCTGLFIRNRLAGFAMMLYREVLVKGQKQMVLYFGDMVVHPFARGKGFLYRVSDAFLKGVTDKMMGYAVIMQGNRAAKRMLNRFHPRYPNMPYSKMIGEWHAINILLTFSISRKTDVSVRHARMKDADSIVRLLANEYSARLFSPAVTNKSFINDIKTGIRKISDYYVAELSDEIVGVCCAVDLTPFKQNRILQYRRQFKWVRLIYQFFALIFHFPEWPPEGQPLRDITVTDYAVKNRNPDILRSILIKIYNEFRQKSYHLLIFGCGAEDPLIEAARGFVSQSVVSDIIIFSKSERVIDQWHDTSCPFIDMELL